MTAEFIRDAAVTAAVFGFFASSWFGWGLDDPPRRWRPWLVGGVLLSLLTAVAGGLLAWQHWSDPSAIGPDNGPTFGIIVGVEFALAGLGAWILSRRGKSEWITAWIALVVGVHFFLLAPLLQYPILYLLAALMTLAAIFTPWVANRRGISTSAAVGLVTGTLLLAVALFSLGTAVLA